MRCFGSRKSNRWHKNVSAVTALAEGYFACAHLQKHTDIYLKKKGSLAPEQVNQRLLGLIQDHGDKGIAILACGHLISSLALRNWILHELNARRDIDHDPSFSLLRCIVAAHRVNPEAVTATEVVWARELVTLPQTGMETSYQRLETILKLLTDGVTPELLLYNQVVALSREVCATFALQLESLKHDNRWIEAYDATRWLSTTTVDSNEMTAEVFGLRQLFDSCFQAWRAWAAWRPEVARLHLWQVAGIANDDHMHPFLALEGPDFESGGSATMSEGLITQCLSSHSSGISWGDAQVQFECSDIHKAPAILDLLTSAVDATCLADSEYKALFVELCISQVVTEKNLQILEAVRATRNPSLSALLLQAFAQPHEENDIQLSLIRQALPALNDSRTLMLRELLAPYLIVSISSYIEETQHQLRLQLEASKPWSGIETQLLIVITELQKATWLLPMLDDSLRALANNPPLLENLEALKALRVEAQSVTPAITTFLVLQIDTYCKAILVLNCEVDEATRCLVEALIALWQSGPDRNRRELALIIAQKPKSDSKLQSQCLSQLSFLSNDFVFALLGMLRQSNEDFASYVEMTRLLAAETQLDVVSCWRSVLYRGIERHDTALIEYGQTHLSVGKWLEWLKNLRSIYNNMMDSYSVSLLKPDFHSWPQRLAENLPVLNRLEKVHKQGTTMQYLLKRPETPFEAEDLIQVLELARESERGPSQQVADVVISQFLHQDRTVHDIKECLFAISDMTSKGAEACMRVINLCQQGSGELAETVAAGWLQSPVVDELDHVGLRALIGLFGIALGASGRPSTDSLDVSADFLDNQILEIVGEARRLEDLRLSLNAIDPEGVSNLFAKLGIEVPSVLDENIMSLPTALIDVVERVGENEVEMQFPLSDLKVLQRAAMGIGDAQSLLVRLIIPSKDMPSGFCIHYSNEAEKTSVASLDHTPWLVLENSKAPNLQYCRGRASRGVYQLSRTLWRHLKTGFISLEETYAIIASNIAELARSCIICGNVHGIRLRRSTVCHETACRDVFATVTYEIRLAEIGQTPTVVDFLLSIIHAAALTGKRELLADCPIKETAAILEFITNLPPMTNLQKHLFVNTSDQGPNLQATTLKRYSPNPAKLDILLSWACNSYGGFITPATGSLRIPSFPGAHQFLLVNASPDLEISFSAHMLTAQSKSMVLFHGTSLDRLHAILCQGLRVCSGTSLQRHGAAHGNGIYMAEEPKTAWSYANTGSATTSASGWKGSTFNNTRVLLGCELAGQSTSTGDRGIHVITDAKRLMVRYILLMAPKAAVPIAGHVIPAMKSTFASLRSGTI